MVLGVRKHGETSVIAELMTRSRGRHLGLVQGGRSRTQRAMLQPGNRVTAKWRARLSEHLGQYRLEPLQLRAGTLMEAPHMLMVLQTLASHLRLLAERDSHPALYDAANVVLDNTTELTIAGSLLVRFELALLEELGFGIDLSQCAVSKTSDDLAYVSPKSGKAVSAEAGQPYHERLLSLPDFLLAAGSREREATPQNIIEGFRLTGYFLNRHVFDVRGIAPPNERDSLIRILSRL